MIRHFALFFKITLGVRDVEVRFSSVILRRPLHTRFDHEKTKSIRCIMSITF